MAQTELPHDLDARLKALGSPKLNSKEMAVPAFGEFLGQLIVAFGGPDNLAGEFYSTYKSTKAGSPARVSLVLKLSDLLLRNTQHFGAPAKVEDMSDDELKRALGAFLGSENARRELKHSGNSSGDS